MSENNLHVSIEIKDKYQHQLKVLTENLNHPLMKTLFDRVLYLVDKMMSRDSIKMPALHDHIKFLIKEYEIQHDARYPDVVTLYNFAECCGYTVVVKKANEELKIRYNPKAPFSL
jgi:hypothetical protein